MAELPTTPGSVVYWLGAFAHLREDGRWVDDNGEAATADRLATYSHPELYVVWDAKRWPVAQAELTVGSLTAQHVGQTLTLDSGGGNVTGTLYDVHHTERSYSEREVQCYLYLTMGNGLKWSGTVPAHTPIAARPAVSSTPREANE